MYAEFIIKGYMFVNNGYSSRNVELMSAENIEIQKGKEYIAHRINSIFFRARIQENLCRGRKRFFQIL